MKHGSARVCKDWERTVLGDLICPLVIYFFNQVFVIFLNSFSARFVTALMSKTRLSQDMCWSRLNLVEVLRALAGS